jgi:hypothetical protein
MAGQLCKHSKMVFDMSEWCGKCGQNNVIVTNGGWHNSNNQIIYTVTPTTTNGWIDALSGTSSISYPATVTTNSSLTFGSQQQLDSQWMSYYYSNFIQNQYMNVMYQPVMHPPVMHPPETAQERAEREARYEKKLAEELAKREAAQLRAEKLLFTILTPTQVKQYTDDGYFDCPVNERLYRIKNRVSGNVELIEGGRAVAKYCAHPTDAYETPVPDVMLSQLLMLQSNEAEFLRVANRTVLQ